MRSIRRAIRSWGEGGVDVLGVADAMRRTWDGSGPRPPGLTTLGQPECLPPRVVEALSTIACEAVTNGRAVEELGGRLAVRRRAPTGTWVLAHDPPGCGPVARETRIGRVAGPETARRRYGHSRSAS